MQIIGISGTKQAGKNTVANYINGKILKEIKMISDFAIDSNGQLEICTSNHTGQQGWGVFDVTRKDSEFVQYAEMNIWPYVKIYHFADCLKQMCVELFDLKPQQVYGTDDDKNTMTQYGKTAREFLQYLGTDVMRSIKDTVWVDYTIKKIVEERSGTAIIPDVRFPNEVDAIHSAGGIVIRLTRNPYNSNHRCEQALSKDNFDWNKFDLILDNNDSSLAKLLELLENIQNVWSI